MLQTSFSANLEAVRVFQTQSREARICMLGSRSDDDNIPLPQVYQPVGRLIGPWFGRPHRSTIIRWIVEGVRLPGGQRVRLRAWRRGRIWLTTAEAAAEFAQSILSPSDGPKTPRTVAARTRADDIAVAELRAMGMCGSSPNE
jgi:hypothetical protein